MKKILCALFIAWLVACNANISKAQFLPNTQKSLFSDVKAFKVGDALMVLIVEDTEADNSATTSTSRSTELSAGLQTGSSETGGGISSGNSAKGSGQTTRNEKIRSKLSVRVTELDDNGNLMIEGNRQTKINGETQKITIRGAVRPVDVLPNNSVYSYSILDLSLFIEGEGSVSTVQEPGLITKFLRFLF